MYCIAGYAISTRRGYRAGLPEEVASLVTGVHENWTKVKLVNLDPVKARDVVVQTGGYGEHQCSHVESGDTILSVNDNHFTVHLEPGTGSELTIYHDRYANQPSLKFPGQLTGKCASAKRLGYRYSRCLDL